MSDTSAPSSSGHSVSMPDSQKLYDAIIIGAGFAGLSAAMQLARARKEICIIDAGLPRNRFAAASHGFFGMDGKSPDEIARLAMGQIRAYPTVSIGYVLTFLVAAIVLHEPVTVTRVAGITLICGGVVLLWCK